MASKGKDCVYFDPVFVLFTVPTAKSVRSLNVVVPMIDPLEMVESEIRLLRSFTPAWMV